MSSLFSLFSSGRFVRSGSTCWAVAAVLWLALLVTACGAVSDQARDAGPGGSRPSPAAASCDRDAMGRRPCPQSTPEADQSQRPRYKSDQGEESEEYHRAAYRGESYEYCKDRLDRSFQAYKACVRY